MPQCGINKKLLVAQPFFNDVIYRNEFIQHPHKTYFKVLRGFNFIGAHHKKVDWADTGGDGDAMDNAQGLKGRL